MSSQRFFARIIWRVPAPAAFAFAFAYACGGSDQPATSPTPQKYTLAVTGSGSGTVLSSPSGISCTLTNGTGTGVCAAQFDVNTRVVLQAVSATNQSFDGWTGDCTGAQSCQITIAQNRNVSATFKSSVRALSLSFSTPASDDGAVLLSIVGPAIDSVRPRQSLELVERRESGSTSETRRVMLRGNVIGGVVAVLYVKGSIGPEQFRVTLEQVAARRTGNYQQRTTLQTYSLVLTQ